LIGNPTQIVTDYIDYRLFLRDFYQFQKENTRHFSHRYFADKAGLYFKHLVLFNQATIAADKREHYQVLRAMKGIVIESVLQSSQYDYFSNWYLPILAMPPIPIFTPVFIGLGLFPSIKTTAG
jgi:hypothetical protein